MNTRHASSSQSRPVLRSEAQLRKAGEAQNLLVRPVSGDQKKLAKALAFQLSGRGEAPAYQKRVARQLLTALNTFGGSIVGFENRR